MPNTIKRLRLITRGRVFFYFQTKLPLKKKTFEPCRAQRTSGKPQKSLSDTKINPIEILKRVFSLNWVPQVSFD